ncbi:MAG: hypothetical protein QOI12_1478 [Alphaproteobacteria bacterium]|jgi:hypothetical protein|nr:hypothetical protein [Alphaproteobacteria bacterium]
MAGHPTSSDRKVDRPAAKFEKPSDVVKAAELSHDEKRRRLIPGSKTPASS